MNIPIIFHRHKVKQHRDRASFHIKDHDWLLEQTYSVITDKITDLNRTMDWVLDVGGYHGLLKQKILPILPKSTYISTDFSERLVALSDGLRVVMDEELVCFSPSSFDLIVSHLCLHWTNDLPGSLAQLNHLLKPNGMALLSVFGPATLQELRHCIQTTEMEIKNHKVSRTSPLVDVKSLGSLMQRVGFESVVTDSQLFTLSYPDLNTLIYDLRGIAQTSAMVSDAPSLNKTLWQNIEKHYKSLFLDTDGDMMVTIEVVTATGLANV